MSEQLEMCWEDRFPTEDLSLLCFTLQRSRKRMRGDRWDINSLVARLGIKPMLEASTIEDEFLEMLASCTALLAEERQTASIERAFKGMHDTETELMRERTLWAANRREEAFHKLAVMSVLTLKSPSNITDITDHLERICMSNNKNGGKWKRLDHRSGITDGSIVKRWSSRYEKATTKVDHKKSGQFSQTGVTRADSPWL